MQRREFWALREVADDALERSLVELLMSGARTEARVLAHLAEVEERRLHLAAGFGSLFEYCLRRLGLSEDEACRRITGARLARRFPVIFELIEARRIHLTGVGLLRHVSTDENHRELLNATSGKSRREIEALLAVRFPWPDVDSFVRKLPVPFSSIQQRSAETFRIQLNASRSLKEKLELACDLLSHGNPQRNLARVIERGLDLLIERTERERFGKTSRPRRRAAKVAPVETALAPGRAETSPALEQAETSPALEQAETSAALEQVGASPALEQVGASPSLEQVGASPALGRVEAVERGEKRVSRARIPSATRREVTMRDGETCSFLGPDGHRCGARAFLQLHHEQAWALGGADEPDNLRWLCAAHNRLMAEQDFGAAYIAEMIRRLAG